MKACSISGFSRELMSKRKNKPLCFKMKWMHWKWQGGYSLTFFNKSFVSEKKKVHNIPNRQFLQETDMICGFQGCTFNTFRLTHYILKPVNWRWRCISKVKWFILNFSRYTLYLAMKNTNLLENCNLIWLLVTSNS